jgi:hypothetical protein
MPRCPTCDYPLPRERERLGARCPHCHDPLFEAVRRPGRPAQAGEGACPAHPGVAVAGTCARCGNYLCEVCRTRWRDQIVCAACVSRALELREAAPEQVRAHRRQALVGFGLGLTAWVLGVGSLLLIGILGPQDPDDKSGMRLAGLLALLALALAALTAALGLGQAATALRTRGSYMILATIGLLASGLFLGAFLGLFSFSMWQQ